MSQTVTIEMELPDDLAQFRLPAGVHSRLQALLDRQDQGQRLTVAEVGGPLSVLVTGCATNLFHVRPRRHHQPLGLQHGWIRGSAAQSNSCRLLHAELGPDTGW